MHKNLLAALMLSLACAGAGAVDVNQANDMELDSLKGIGPALSGRVIQERAKGAFRDWNELLARVKGLGPVQAARLSAQGLTVGGAPFTPTGKAVAATANSEKTR